MRPSRAALVGTLIFLVALTSKAQASDSLSFIKGGKELKDSWGPHEKAPEIPVGKNPRSWVNYARGFYSVEFPYGWKPFGKPDPTNDRFNYVKDPDARASVEITWAFPKKVVPDKDILTWLKVAAKSGTVLEKMKRVKIGKLRGYQLAYADNSGTCFLATYLRIPRGVYHISAFAPCKRYEGFSPDFHRITLGFRPYPKLIKPRKRARPKLKKRLF